MRKLILWSIGLDVFLTVLLVATAWIGSQEPLPEPIRETDLNDCSLPCWAGITPGKTTLTDAKQQIYTIFGRGSVVDLYRNDPYAKSERYSFQISLHSANISQWTIRLELDPSKTLFLTTQAIIQEVSLYPPADPDNPAYPGDSFTIGDLVRLFGPPATIGFIETPTGNGLFELYFQAQHLIVYVNNSGVWCVPITPAQKIHSLMVFDDSTPKSWMILFPQPWQGFRSCYQFWAS